MVAAGARPRLPRAPRDGADVAQLAAAAAARDRRPRPRPDQVQRRRRERDPRARPARRAPRARAARAGRSAASPTACRCRAAAGWSTCTPPRTRRTRTRADVELARVAALEWAGGEPVILGGDFNLVAPRAARLRARGLATTSTTSSCAGIDGGDPEVLDAGRLSDHRAAARQRWRRPKPRSISSAFSPSVPGLGSTPSWTAAS